MSGALGGGEGGGGLCLFVSLCSYVVSLCCLSFRDSVYQGRGCWVCLLIMFMVWDVIGSMIGSLCSVVVFDSGKYAYSVYMLFVSCWYLVAVYSLA